MVEYAGGTARPRARRRAARRAYEIAGIDLPRGFVEGLIGVDYTRDEIVGALEMIGCDRRRAPRATGRCTRPSWRPDLTDKWTLAEEVARIEGYDRIPSVLPTPPSGRGLTAAQQGRRRVAQRARRGRLRRDALVRRSRPRSRTTCTARRRAAHLPSVKLANPLDGQSPFLRRSLVPGPAAASRTATSSRGFTDLALFETGVGLPPGAGRRVRHVVRAASRGATGCRDPRRAGRVDPAAAPARRGAAHGHGSRRSSPARPPRPPTSPTRSTPCARSRRPRASRSRSPRPSAPRCTRAAPACSRWARPRSATSASFCRPWPRPPIFPVA